MRNILTNRTYQIVAVTTIVAIFAFVFLSGENNSEDAEVNVTTEAATTAEVATTEATTENSEITSGENETQNNVDQNSSEENTNQ